MIGVWIIVTAVVCLGVGFGTGRASVTYGLRRSGALTRAYQQGVREGSNKPRPGIEPPQYERRAL